MSIIVDVLHLEQQIAMDLSGSLKHGLAFPQRHFLFLMSIIVDVLHLEQQIAMDLSGSLKHGCAFPQRQTLYCGFIFSLCVLHLKGIPYIKAYDALFLQFKYSQSLGIG
jgi:hypothetical protein